MPNPNQHQEITKLRILHTEASSGWGGQEIRILTESQVFIRHGHEVAVAADKDSQIAKKAANYGVSAYPIRLKRKRIPELLAMRKLIQTFKPDVISCHSSTDHWLCALARLTLKDKPLIIRTRHISTAVHRNRSSKWLYNKGADAVMTTGKFIQAQLTEDGFISSDRVFSVPTGIDTTRFISGDKANIRNQLGIPTAHTVFGIVATLRSWKGHQGLIEAFGKLTTDNVSLVIVGNGPQHAHLQAVAKQQPNAAHIHFMGEQSDVLPYLQSMDCFVLPSYANEGVPQAMLQAMAVGLPIISCPIGGIPETLDHYSAATLVPPKDVDALSLAMLHFCAMPKADQTAIRSTPFTLETMYQSVMQVISWASSHRKI